MLHAAFRWIRGGIPTDIAIVARDVGSLLSIQAGLMAVSVLVAALFQEWYVAAAFVAAAVATGGVGLGARRWFADAPDPMMKHGMIIAAAGWLMTALFGSLPFLLSAYAVPPGVQAAYVPAGVDYAHSSLVYFQNPLHAVFESMSGWTGSGLTMAVHEPSLPRGLLWWRSLIQWVGGVGVIVLTVSILARPGSGSYALYRSEARERKIHPSIVSTVRSVWKLFVGYTVLAIVLLFLAIQYGDTAPLPPTEAAWQAINHAMTGLATGGFSVTDNSIATYDSPTVEAVLLPIMTLGAIAFPIHYLVVVERDWRQLVSDVQTRWLLILLVGGSALLAVQHVATWSGPASTGSRDAIFQFVSALSCTGFQSAPIGTWADSSKIIISSAMILGGAAGSTVGGIKIIRAYTVARGIRWQFSRVFLPANAIVSTSIGDRRLGQTEMEREFSEAALVSMLWLFLLLVSSLVLMNLAGPDFSFADAFFEVASAQGNVGLSTGITGPTMAPLAEGMFVLNMWVGRLEIIPVLVFARSLLYGSGPRI